MARGDFKWVVRTISPTYDIHALYTKIISLANKATWISHALEFRKIFTMQSGGDIFQYHAELLEQIKLVKMQGESLGLPTQIPSWMEQSLLLIAAWQLPQYRKIALEFTMDDKAVSVETLVRELEKQRLLTAHLNSNKGGGKAEGPRPGKTEARVAATSAVKYCHAFQKGPCPRGKDCPFTHEKDPAKSTPREKHTSVGGSKKATKKKDGKKRSSKDGGSGSSKSCFKCGSTSHMAPECKFEGKCDYCKKDGHKQTVCRKKASDSVAKIVIANEDTVAVRAATVHGQALDNLSGILGEDHHGPTQGSTHVSQAPHGPTHGPTHVYQAPHGLTQGPDHGPDHGPEAVLHPPVLASRGPSWAEDELDTSEDESPHVAVCKVWPEDAPVDDPDSDPEEVVVARMVNADEYKQEAPGVPPANLLHKIDRAEEKRKYKNKVRIKQYERRDKIERALYNWRRTKVLSYGEAFVVNLLAWEEREFKLEADNFIDTAIQGLGMSNRTGDAIYLLYNARKYAEALHQIWVVHIPEQNYWSEDPPSRDIVANVMVVQEKPAVPVVVTYVNTKWCVDSGANRDICKEVALAKGRQVDKKLTIGEAGSGHSFTSEAEGPISISAQGKKLPLLTRTIFAKKIHENIFSVAEAVDKGYAMVFEQSGVYMHEPSNVKVLATPILSGGRNKKNRLFYFDLSQDAIAKVGIVDDQGPLALSDSPPSFRGVPCRP